MPWDEKHHLDVGFGSDPYPRFLFTLYSIAKYGISSRCMLVSSCHH